MKKIYFKFSLIKSMFPHLCAVYVPSDIFKFLEMDECPTTPIIPSPFINKNQILVDYDEFGNGGVTSKVCMLSEFTDPHHEFNDKIKKELE